MGKDDQTSGRVPGMKISLPGKDFRPNRRLADPRRGALAYVPNGVHYVTSFGGKSASPSTTTSPTATAKKAGPGRVIMQDGIKK